MTDTEKVKVLREALQKASCDYGNLNSPFVDPDARKNPQTDERHQKWCTKCRALALTV